MKELQLNTRNKVLSWCENIEESALAQIKNLAELPFIVGNIAIMPDCHAGYGMPIGGVLATNNVIIPNAVGVDIGCGMCAVRTSLTEIDTDTLKKIMGEIRDVVPVGFNKHKEQQDINLMPEMVSEKIIGEEILNARKSLGTLGGGNHFIEIQKGDDNHIWIMLHSGSRNLGKQVADYYNKLAIELNQKWYSNVPKEYELAFLLVDSEEGQAYIREMNYCVAFAFANRKLMMDRIKNIFHEVICLNPIKEGNYKKGTRVVIDFSETINIAHNYASLEHHFGKDVWVHRKGATLAREGTIGIIPGSQGSTSYIVKGKGNKASLESCSHGAGRLMSRAKVREELSVEEESEKLDKLGVIHSIRNKAALDEAPSAYKDITDVMRQQEDLVKILVKLKPLAVIKA